MNKDKYVKLQDVVLKEDKDVNTCEDKMSLEKEKKDVYQIQVKLDKNEENINIIKVGNFNKIPTVIINRFDYNLDYHCLILSCFYDKDFLMNSDSKLNMFKILINIKKSIKLYPIGCITTTLNINTKISKLLEIENMKFKGSYSINFYFDDKEINLENFDKFLGFELFVEKMINYLNYDKIKTIMENKLNVLN